MKIYLFIYLGSALLALMIIPLVIRIARYKGLVDPPGPRSVHRKPKPNVGGVAIFISVMFSVVVVMFVSNITSEAPRSNLSKMVVVLCATTFMFAIGLVDDIKPNGLKVRVKFLAQLVAALWICIFGIRIQSVVFTNWLEINLYWLSWPLTLLWIVGITNAMNLCDGLDGLAAGVAAAACGVIALLGWYSGNLVMTIFMLAMLGSLTSFLFFNVNPAHIFMGDSGSMFLGFTIASSSLLCSLPSTSFVDLALPVLALGVPLLDTLFCIVRRLLEGRSPFSPDRRHFHHKLLEMGISQRRAVIVVHSLTLLSAGLGISMLFYSNESAIMVFLLVLLLLVVVFYVVGYIHPVEMLASLHRVRMRRSQKWQDTRSFEEAQLYFRRAVTFEQWWRAVLTAAEKMGLSSLNMPLKNRDGSYRILKWDQKDSQDQKEESQKNNTLKLNLPIRDLRSGEFLDLEIAIHRNGSLESAGRRIMLFSRLIEEHELHNLPQSTKPRQFAQKDVYRVIISDVVDCKDESVRRGRHSTLSSLPEIGGPGRGGNNHG